MNFNNLDEQSPIVKQPKGLHIKLRPHQLTSIAAMKELEKQSSIIIDKPDITSSLYQIVKFKLNDLDEFTGSTFVIETNSAILADKVGSGKTYMMIGLILNQPVPIVHDRFIIGTDHFSIKMMSIKECESVNLVVVPHNLSNQWAEFLDKSDINYLQLNAISDFDVFFDIDYVTKQILVPNQSLVIYTEAKKKFQPKKRGSKTVKKDNKIYARKMLNIEKVRKILDEKTVFVLNINRYKFFKQIFRSTKWARVIVDEMDSASIPSMFDEYGNFNWFLTATPTAIFYKSCRRYVNKIFGYYHNLLQYFVVKNKDEYVDKSIALPKPHVYIINTLMHKVVSAIKDLIPADVLRLINAGNMREAVAKLNCDIDTEENIVKVLTAKIHTEMHNLTKELAYVKELIPVDQDAHEKRIKKLEDEIGRCKTKLETVTERMKSIKDECCFICTEPFDTPAILDCCKNVFCLKCLLASLKIANNKCPFCRHVIKNNKEYHIISAKPKPIKKSALSEKNKTKGFDEMDKADVLENVLAYISDNDDKPRILIFSDYVQTFDKIVKNITKANLEYALMSGIPAHITNVINDFNNGNINVLLLDSQHYGSGLNLQAAQYLILYHRMIPELETQVVGRAQRERRIPLKVIYLVNDSENKISNLSTDPIQLDNKDELWMIMNHPDDVDNEPVQKQSKKSKKTRKLVEV